MRHEAVFNYNLSRPYPYPWFTWVVVIGGLVATAVFSIINFAADGYSLITISSINPNETVAEKHWFQKEPWAWASKISSTCQPQNIAWYSRIGTNKGGVNYLLAGISTSNDALGPSLSAPSLKYLNNVLEGCNLQQMTVTWTNSSSGTNYNFSSSTLGMTSFWTCSILNEQSETNISIVADVVLDGIGYLSSGTEYYEAFGQTTGGPQSTYTPEAGWSQALIKYYGEILLEKFFSAISDKYSGIATYAKDFVPLESDVLSPDFWLILYPGINYQNGTALPDFGGLPGEMYSFLDSFAKSLYSAVLTDLGQSVPSNLFANPMILVEFMREHTASVGDNPNRYSLPPLPPPGANVTRFYEEQMFPLPSVTPSTIAAEYLCQIPQRKSAASLIISILVADLVFLQVLWKIFNLIVTFFVGKRDPEANYCQGCATAFHHGQSQPAKTDSVSQIEEGRRTVVELQTMTPASDDQVESTKLLTMIEGETMQTFTKRASTA